MRTVPKHRDTGREGTAVTARRVLGTSCASQRSGSGIAFRVSFPFFPFLTCLLRLSDRGALIQVVGKVPELLVTLNPHHAPRILFARKLLRHAKGYPRALSRCLALYSHYPTS